RHRTAAVFTPIRLSLGRFLTLGLEFQLATLAAGTREIQLIAAQDVIADPPARFTARRLR
ncbi:DUF1622 domain-containing protein, partial [Micromonospora luteifusca]|uniref:DUF1622 domain-containing protein n=1 Tax=Micromonospora luteifusca TaxID=709860 RepID=UPI003488B517